MRARKTSRNDAARDRNKPEFNEEIIGTVLKIVPGGDGLMRAEGRAVFVPFVLPGEKVTIRITGGRKDFLRGEVKEILEPSEKRRIPPCPLFTKCGGCNFQHMSYAEQLSAKQSIVREAFERTGKVKIDLPPIIPSEPFHYRNRVQIHRRADGRLGFMRRDSNDIIEVRHCLISVPPVNRLFESPPGNLPERFIVFAWNDELRSDADGGRNDDVVLMIAGRTLTFNAGGFFQSNLGMLEKFLPDFVSAALRVTPVRDLLLDLYAGAGLFGSFLNDHFRKIVSVELNADSIRAARSNVKGNLHEFHAVDVDRWVKEAGSIEPDLIVVDPPRTGLSESVRRFLAGSGVQAVLYVSCDPVTLARDATNLLKEGFTLSELTLYDFYPQTSHIESFAVFTRSSGRR